MLGDEIIWGGASTIAAAVQRKEVSPLEVADVFLEHVAAVNPALNAIVFHDPDKVRAEARGLTDRIQAGDDVGPIAGVPYAIKDLHHVAGEPRSMGVPFLAGEIDQHSDVGTSRLASAGGLNIGRTNSPEFGWRGLTDNHQFGPTHNPWKLGHTPGGSSGGAAAGVAAGLFPLGDGSDGAGSIRIPAAFSGVVGLKPSFGRIPIEFGTWGQTNLHRGPLTRTVADAALMFSVMAGGHPDDPHSIPGPAPDVSTVEHGDLRGARIGWHLDLGLFQVDSDVADRFSAAVSVFERNLGASVEESAPAFGPLQDIMWDVWCRLYAVGAPLVGLRGSGVVDEGLLDVIEEGLAIPNGRTAELAARRMNEWQTLVSWFDHHDYLLVPTLPCVAFPHDREHQEHLDGGTLEERTLGWLSTYVFNLFPQCPVISLPCGFVDGLPVGLSIVGRPWDDIGVLRAARCFEDAAGWAHIRPEV